MKTFNRLLLVLLSVALLTATCSIYSGTTRSSFGHDTFYTFKWPWLLTMRHASLFGVLIWCVLFVKREPLFVRVGLMAVILALVIIIIVPLRSH